jgi:hypothetical protein
MYVPSLEYQEFVIELSFPKYLFNVDCVDTELSLMISRAVIGLAAEFEEFQNVPYNAPTSEAAESELGDILFWYANIYHLVTETVNVGEAEGNVFANPEDDIHLEVYQSLFGMTEKLTRKTDIASLTKYLKSILYFAKLLLEEAYEHYEADYDEEAVTLSELEAKNRAKLEARVQKQGSPT